MADLISEPKKPRIDKRDHAQIAAFVSQEYERRRSRTERRAREAAWREVDRQVAMQPPDREFLTGDRYDWFPSVELPWQANTLEVVKADLKRLKFPKNSFWYSPNSNITEEYQERWARRRDSLDIVEGQEGMALNQDTADTIVRSVMDYYHRLNGFRDMIDLGDTELVKFGTTANRVLEVNYTEFFTNNGQVIPKNMKGPAIVVSSMYQTFLDDSPMRIKQEGFAPRESTIRVWAQDVNDMKRGAASGGADKGWIVKNAMQVTGGEVDNRKDHVEMLEYEGDLFIKRSDRTIFLPDCIATVARSQGDHQLVRLKVGIDRTWVTEVYQRNAVELPYGDGPLSMGQPLQEAATLTFNMMNAVAALNGLPPISWDKNDPVLSAMGGPAWAPAAQWDSDDPRNNIEVHEVGSLSELVATFQLQRMDYENLTGNLAPRRGEQAKSHTTALSTEVEQVRGLMRSEDVVLAQEERQLPKILAMEYEIIRRTMPRMSIPVSGMGQAGFITVGKEDLPDEVSWEVMGSAGSAKERMKAQNFLTAAQMHLQLFAMAQQMGMENVPAPNIDAMISEIYESHDIDNGARFSNPVESPASGIASPPGLPGPDTGNVEQLLLPGQGASTG